MQLIRLSEEDPRRGERRLNSEDLRFLLLIDEAQLGAPQPLSTLSLGEHHSLVNCGVAPLWQGQENEN